MPAFRNYPAYLNYDVSISVSPGAATANAEAGLGAVVQGSLVLSPGAATANAEAGLGAVVIEAKRSPVTVSIEFVQSQVSIEFVQAEIELEFV